MNNDYRMNTWDASMKDLFSLTSLQFDVKGNAAFGTECQDVSSSIHAPEMQPVEHSPADDEDTLNAYMMGMGWESAAHSASLASGKNTKQQLPAKHAVAAVEADPLWKLDSLMAFSPASTYSMDQDSEADSVATVPDDQPKVEFDLASVQLYGTALPRETKATSERKRKREEELSAGSEEIPASVHSEGGNKRQRVSAAGNSRDHLLSLTLTEEHRENLRLILEHKKQAEAQAAAQRNPEKLYVVQVADPESDNVIELSWTLEMRKEGDGDEQCCIVWVQAPHMRSGFNTVKLNKQRRTSITKQIYSKLARDRK